jgi:hypothetical protein
MLFISAHVSEQTVLLLNWLLRVLSAPSLFFPQPVPAGTQRSPDFSPTPCGNRR